MAIPTVFLVGTDRLPLVEEYLNLGSVVVVAPDRSTLRRWTDENEPTSSSPEPAGPGPDAVIDLAGRRIVTGDGPLPVSDLEFRVLSALLSPPGRAVPFRELRQRGWGDGHEVEADVYAVRALVQRLRAKLKVAECDLQIEAVRGYGFRASLGPESVRAPCAATDEARSG
jgi:DNA-binding response OmpR family regulator